MIRPAPTVRRYARAERLGLSPPKAVGAALQAALGKDGEKLDLSIFSQRGL